MLLQTEDIRQKKTETDIKEGKTSFVFNPMSYML
jgi:hypothetical protein